MGFMDKVMSKAQEVGKAGHAKVDEVQAKRQVDDLLRQLGAAAYAEKTGRPSSAEAGQLEQAVSKLQEMEAAHPDLFAGGAATPGGFGAAGGFGGPGGAPVAVVPTAFSGAGSSPSTASPQSVVQDQEQSPEA